MNEKLDIFDEFGNPSGKTELRSIVHATGLWHQVVHIYFYRKSSKDIEILVHLRSKSKDLNPNKWDTRFGGHIIAGGTVESALRKELYEETGLHIDLLNIQKRSVYKKANFPNNELVTSYFYNYKDDLNKLKFNDGEVQAVKWMTADEIVKSMEQNFKIWASNIRSFNRTIKEIKNLIR